jgi:exodeoxyribonuclease VII small subunit
MTKQLSFEDAFTRLETILETMNQKKATLEESVRLFEEAESLLKLCHQHLGQAETKIEVLLKHRKEPLLNATGQPQTAPFEMPPDIRPL